MGFDVPILFLIFNRPDLTAELVSVSRQVGLREAFF